MPLGATHNTYRRQGRKVTGNTMSSVRFLLIKFVTTKRSKIKITNIYQAMQFNSSAIKQVEHVTIVEEVEQISILKEAGDGTHGGTTAEQSSY
jgi:hypothetical protein